MARLAIRQLRYIGLKYEFVSPVFEDGVNLIEGDNGTGKTTFSDLLYFSLGGNVSKFKNSSREKHKEIAEDSDNYAELLVEIGDEKFKLKRYLNTNDIAIFSESEMVGVFPITRRENNKIFSDWMLEKLAIPNFKLHFSKYNGRINFTDLFRLIYHDQTQDAGKIYKSPDTENFISDSSIFRKAIFETLIGQSFGDYYKAVDELNSLERELTDNRATISAFSTVARKISTSEDWNSKKLKTVIDETGSQITKLLSLRESLRKINDTGNSEQVIKDLNSELEQMYLNLSEKKESHLEIINELRKLNDLRANLILEITQIKKITFTHEQLNLFSADTCPYCLSLISRPTAKCICGCAVDEASYERFFYDTSEYMTMLKSKQRNFDTVEDAIKSCENQLAEVQSEINSGLSAISSLEEKIKIRIQERSSGFDLSKLNEIDSKIIELKSKEDSLEKQLHIEQERQKLEDSVTSLQGKISQKKILVEKLEVESKEKMFSVLESFNEKYNVLMQETVENCRRARINDDYLPVINDGDYVEASAIVPKRLMYFLTLLHLSLEIKDINFPRFLVIDTPDTAGIDDGNLKKCMEKISEVIGDRVSQCQVIITTGVDMYPDSLAESVKLKLTKTKRLLSVKSTSAD